MHSGRSSRLAHNVRAWAFRLAPVAVIAVAATLAFLAPASAVDSSGINLQPRVLGPTSTPAPIIEVPVDVPVDVPVAEATFSVSLSGLEPYSFIEIFANSTPVLIASGFADESGTFEAEVQLPPNIAPGEHSISATNTLSDGTKVSTVVVEFAVSESGILAPKGSMADGSGSTASGSGSGSSAGGVGAEVTFESTSLGGSEVSGYLGPDPFNLGGVFYLGNLAAWADYTNGAYFPDAKLQFAVKNVSRDIVPASAHLWVSGPLGITVADVPRYLLVGLEPGETRLVTATVRGIGQWGIYSGHLVFTPPETVNGGDAIAFEREATFGAFSVVAALLLLVAALAGLVSFVGFRYFGWRLGKKGSRSQTPSRSPVDEVVPDTSTVPPRELVDQ